MIKLQLYQDCKTSVANVYTFVSRGGRTHHIFKGLYGPYNFYREKLLFKFSLMYFYPLGTKFLLFHQKIRVNTVGKEELWHTDVVSQT